MKKGDFPISNVIWLLLFIIVVIIIIFAVKGLLSTLLK